MEYTFSGRYRVEYMKPEHLSIKNHKTQVSLIDSKQLESTLTSLYNQTNAYDYI